MIKSELYPNLKVDEYWSITKIYHLSKKYDDLEMDLYSHLLYVVYFAKNKDIRLRSRSSKLKLCRFLWKCIKVSLLLCEDLEENFITIVECIEYLLSEGGTIINREFRETQDTEVLNFPDPDKLDYINEVRLLLNIKHKTELAC